MYQMNMKRLLHPSLKNKIMIDVGESSSEENTKYKKIEGMLSESLEYIEEIFKRILDVIIKKQINKEENVSRSLDEGTSSKPQRKTVS